MNESVLIVGAGSGLSASLAKLSASKVKLIHRRDTLRAEKLLQKKLMANKKIEIIWDLSLIHI